MSQVGKESYYQLSNNNNNNNNNNNEKVPEGEEKEGNEEGSKVANPGKCAS